MTGTSKYEIFQGTNGKIIIREKPQAPSSYTVTIPWKVIVAAIIVIVLFISKLFPTEPKDENIILNGGFVFEDSDVRILTDADLMSIYEMQTPEYDAKKLLRLAINEIYARHNYKFSEAEFADFYNKYSWYNGYLNANEAYLQFNDIENQNIAFLIEAERNDFFASSE